MHFLSPDRLWWGGGGSLGRALGVEAEVLGSVLARNADTGV